MQCFFYFAVSVFSGPLLLLLSPRTSNSDQAGALSGAEVIVTGNQKDFRNATLRVVGPDEFLSYFRDLK